MDVNEMSELISQLDLTTGQSPSSDTDPATVKIGDCLNHPINRSFNSSEIRNMITTDVSMMNQLIARLPVEVGVDVDAFFNSVIADLEDAIFTMNRVSDMIKRYRDQVAQHSTTFERLLTPFVAKLDGLLVDARQLSKAVINSRCIVAGCRGCNLSEVPSDFIPVLLMNSDANVDTITVDEGETRSAQLGLEAAGLLANQLVELKKDAEKLFYSVSLGLSQNE